MMTLDSLYSYIMLAAACCMMTSGLILALVKAPADIRAAKYRVAKHTLAIAVFVIGVLNIAQIVFDSRGSISFLGPCLALAMGYIQAMLFTMSIMVFISPVQITKRSILTQAAIILTVDIVLLGAYFLLPLRAFLFVYELGVVAYLLQLVFYTRWFLRSRREFLNQVSSYYEEDEIERSLRWIFFLFWTALAVGVFSLVMMLNNRIADLCLTVALSGFCALFAACFINYGLSAPVILPAIYQEAPTEERVEEQKEEGTSKLEQWIRNKGYLNNETAIVEIARQSDLTVEQFHRYFRDVVGEDFRTWRLRRRIDEAKLLMTEQPELSIIQIVKMIGFNDRSFFYKQFLRFTGESVLEYRRRLK